MTNSICIKSREYKKGSENLDECKEGTLPVAINAGKQHEYTILGLLVTGWLIYILLYYIIILYYKLNQYFRCKYSQKKKKKLQKL